jgi:hypothetical protein
VGHISDNRPDRAPYAELLCLSDEQVLQRLQAGNTDAFAVIFKRYSSSEICQIFPLANIYSF